MRLSDVAKNLDQTKVGQRPENRALFTVNPATGKPDPVDKSASAKRTDLNRLLSIHPTTDEAKLNKLETAYLAFLRGMGAKWIGVQCITLKIGHDRRYTPDFWVLDEEGLRAIDTKGPHVWEDSLVKISVAARMYPFIHFVIARRNGAVWEHKAIKP